jgi:hypothetical protein
MCGYVAPKVNLFLIGRHVGCCLEPLYLVDNKYNNNWNVWFIALKFCGDSRESLRGMDNIIIQGYVRNGEAFLSL